MAAAARVATKASTREAAKVRCRVKSSSKKRVNPRRRLLGRFSAFARTAFAILVLALLFGYVSVYAKLTIAGFNRSKLLSDCKQARLTNQRLQVEYNRLCSPKKVDALAEKLGMVRATEYDYVYKPTRLAARPVD